MQYTVPILTSKLAPSVAHDLIQRRRLLESFNQLQSKRLGLVVAGAGYGKTTFATQILEHLGMQHIWYALDTDDQDFRTFLLYLIAGFRNHNKNFADTLITRLYEPQIGDPHKKSLLTELIYEMENHIRCHALIILDDFHLVQESQEILDIIDFLLMRMPLNVHILIISRGLPNLRLSGYRARREVIDISERDLAFTREEVGRLCQSLVSVEISNSMIDEFYNCSEGWAAALTLACGVAKNSYWNSTKLVMNGFDKSRELIFEYLEENVFESQPKMIQIFLSKTSLMSWLEPEMCNAFLEIDNSLEILKYLSKNHLLTFPLEGSQHAYCYHDLFRDFLQEQLLKSYSQSTVVKLNRRLGSLFEVEGDMHNALRHYFKGYDYEQLAVLISQIAFQNDRIECPIGLLSQTVQFLPPNILKKYPRVLYIRARLTSMQGNLHQAVNGFQDALDQFTQHGDDQGMICCMKDLFFHHFLMGDVQKAFEEMKTLWKVPDMDPFLCGEVGGYLIHFASILGKIEEADAYYTSALSLVSQSDNSEVMFGSLWVSFCHSVRYYIIGDFEAAEVLISRAIDAFSTAEAELMLILAYVHAARNSYYLRCFEQGIEYADKGLAIARRLGIYDYRYAWLLYVRARNRFIAKDMHKCQQDAYDALAIFNSLGSPLSCCEVHELLGQVGLARGDLLGAEMNMRKSLSLITDTGLVNLQGQISLGLVQVLIAQSRFLEANSILSGLEEQWSISTFNSFRRHMLQALLYEALEKKENSEAALSEALTLTSRYKYDAWVIANLKELAPIISRSSAEKIDRNYINTLLQNTDQECVLDFYYSGLAAKGKEQSKVDRHHENGSKVVSAPLYIYCLGDFKVYVGDRHVPSMDWKNSKATLIFLYLALNVDRDFVHKDVLLELAWPEEDPEITNKRFHVALNFLRRLFEPELKRGQNSSYILRRGDGYQLNIGESGEIDTHKFMMCIDQAEQIQKTDPDGAFRLYLEAENIYKGDLLDTLRYKEWFESFRIRLQNKYLMALSRIMTFYEQNQDWHSCIEYAEKYLAIEEFSENMYCFLMRCHAALGGLSQVEHVYKRCKKRISEDLGYPISADSVKLYEKLTVDFVTQW